MKHKILIPFLLLTASLLLIFLNACSVSDPGLGPDDNNVPSPTLSLSQQQDTLISTISPGQNTPEPTPLLGEILSERTIEPTATLGALTCRFPACCLS